MNAPGSSPTPFPTAMTITKSPASSVCWNRWDNERSPPEGAWLQVPRRPGKWQRSWPRRTVNARWSSSFPRQHCRASLGSGTFSLSGAMVPGKELQVAVVGGEGERQEAEQIAAGLRSTTWWVKPARGDCRHPRAGRRGSQRRLRYPPHCVGLGRPTVSLFGSGIAAKWAPRGPRHVVLNKDLHCSPCTRFGYTPPCPYGTRMPQCNLGGRGDEGNCMCCWFISFGCQ